MFLDIILDFFLYIVVSLIQIILPKGHQCLEFTFVNTGDAPLEIRGVRSSCGCTIPKKPEAPIAPGEKGEITVRYDTNRVGVFRKTITVNTNVSSNSIIALKIKGNVLAN